MGAVMANDRPAKGNSPPSHDDDDRPVSWVSLFRTARAPLAVLVLSAVALIIAPQTGDMLATLSNGGFHFWPALWFQVSLAVLSVSAWYWARTLIDARFDVVGTRADRRRLIENDKRINPFALAAVPWLIVILSVALGVFLIPHGQYLPNLADAAGLGRGLRGDCRLFVESPAGDAKQERSKERSTRGFWRRYVACPLVRSFWQIARPARPGWRW